MNLSETEREEQRKIKLFALLSVSAMLYTQVKKSLIFHCSLAYLIPIQSMGMPLVEALPPIWY